MQSVQSYIDLLKVQTFLQVFFSTIWFIHARKYLNGAPLLSASFLSLCVILPVVNTDKEVKHIKVHQNQNGSFYLEQSQMFQSLENLVEHYRRNSLRSGIRLTRPCTRVRERNKKEKENAESQSCNNSVQICTTLFLQCSPKSEFLNNNWLHLKLQ